MGWGGSPCFQARLFPAPASERCSHPTVVSIELEFAVSVVSQALLLCWAAAADEASFGSLQVCLAVGVSSWSE